MTIPTTTIRHDYVGNGSNDTFPYTFKIFEDTDLKVYVDGVLQTLTTHYTVTGAGTESGGNVEMVTPPGNGLAVAVLADVDFTQTTDLVNETGFYQDRIEDALDKGVRQAQVLEELATRTLRLPEDEAGTATKTTLPSLDDRKGRNLSFDATTGQPVASSPSSAAVSAAMEPVVGAATLANAIAAMGPWGTALVTATGSTAARSLAARFADSINVKDFGAVGDGVADDTAAIQAAVTALASGQTLWIEGNHKLTGSLQISGKSRIRIAGNGRLFLSGASSGAYVFQLIGTVSDLTIEDLTLEGDNNAAYSQTAIGCASGQTISRTSFRNLVIKNINVGISHNANLGGSWDDGVVDGCTLTNLLGSVPGKGYGIHMAKATRINVVNNTIDNASRHSIYQASGDACHNVIAFNKIKNHRSTVYDGTFRAAISIARSSYINVIGNIVADFYDCAIEVAQVTTDAANCGSILVSCNKVTNRKNGVPALLVGEQAIPTSYIVDGVHIHGNEFFEDVVVSGGGSTMVVLNGVNVSVTNNTIRRTGATASLTQAIELGNSSFATSDSHIKNIRVVGNIAESNAAVAGTRFAYVSTQLCTGASPYTVKDNTHNGWETETYFQATPTNVNSKLKFRVSATIDLPSIPAQSGGASAYTVTGCKPTSSVQGRPQYSIMPNGVQVAFYAHDSSVNTVALTYLNPTVGAINPASQTFILFVEDLDP